jgi:hypothetical protein
LVASWPSAARQIVTIQDKIANSAGGHMTVTAGRAAVRYVAPRRRMLTRPPTTIKTDTASRYSSGSVVKSSG